MRLRVLKGWKVMNHDRSSSAAISSARTAYKYDEWVFAKQLHGPLAVFKTKKAAEAFQSWGQIIRPCYYIPSRERGWWRARVSRDLDGKWFVTKIRGGKNIKGKGCAHAVLILRGKTHD